MAALGMSLLSGANAWADDASWQAWLDCAVEGSPVVMGAVREGAATAVEAGAWERAEIRTSVEVAAGAGVTDGAPRGSIGASTGLRDEFAGSARSDHASALVAASEAEVRWTRATVGAQAVLEALSGAAASETVTVVSDALALLDTELSQLGAGAAGGVTDQLAIELLRVVRAEAAARLELATLEAAVSGARLANMTTCSLPAPAELPTPNALLAWSEELVGASYAVSEAASGSLASEAAMTTSGARAALALGGQWEVDPDHAVLLTFGVEFGGRRRAFQAADALLARADAVADVATMQTERAGAALAQVSGALRPYPDPPSSAVEETISEAVGSGLMAPIEAARLLQSMLQSRLEFIELRERSASALIELVLNEVQP